MLSTTCQGQAKCFRKCDFFKSMTFLTGPLWTVTQRRTWRLERLAACPRQINGSIGSWPSISLNAEPTSFSLEHTAVQCGCQNKGFPTKPKTQGRASLPGGRREPINWQKPNLTCPENSSTAPQPNCLEEQMSQTFLDSARASFAQHCRLGPAILPLIPPFRHQSSSHHRLSFSPAVSTVNTAQSPGPAAKSMEINSSQTF